MLCTLKFYPKLVELYQSVWYSPYLTHVPVDTSDREWGTGGGERGGRGVVLLRETCFVQTGLTRVVLKGGQDGGQTRENRDGKRFKTRCRKGRSTLEGSKEEEVVSQGQTTLRGSDKDSDGRDRGQDDRLRRMDG